MIQQTEARTTAKPELQRIGADTTRALTTRQISSDDDGENRSGSLTGRQPERRRDSLSGTSPRWLNVRAGIATRGLAALALAFAVAVSIVGTGSALAAPTDAPYCYKNPVPTYDMAGEYYAPEIPAAIAVNDCGGVQIVWDNDAGRHNAFYAAVDRLPGGGFLAKADEASDGIFPNGANLIGIKPAERGTIQLITTDSNRNISGVFQLTKTR